MNDENDDLEYAMDQLDGNISISLLDTTVLSSDDSSLSIPVSQ